MNRPFEAGDLVIAWRSVLVVNKITDRKLITADYFNGDIRIDFDFRSQKSSDTVEYLSVDDIKTIRKPRPGNPSSRAIVAMLGRQSRIAINNKVNEVGWKFLKEFWKMGGQKEYQTAVFKTAKRMLK